MALVLRREHGYQVATRSFRSGGRSRERRQGPGQDRERRGDHASLAAANNTLWVWIFLVWGKDLGAQ